MAFDIWESRDLPVLRAIVEMADEGVWPIQTQAIAERLSMDPVLVNRSVVALSREAPKLFEFSDGTTYGSTEPQIDFVQHPTGHARRLVGVWPRPEDRVDQLVAVLRLAAEREQDPEQRSRLRKTAEYVGGVGRDLAIGIFTGMITGS